ncbi:Manganese/iron superoxide dismutase [Staphylotrichum tortipilum]|uniref:Superoxide dismutase n=1 Tax=Staphylotrichum tortipilum TaxID=2831512 RepID=A0AAN6MTY0_9PEZI|nr:Manganese/iron superoxide dismutase [Staphylotrichum longicolle]
MVNLASLWQYLALQAPLHSAMSTDALNLTQLGLTAYTLPALPYAYDALEPHISAQIMELHHSKHHQAYVTNLNAALQAHVTAVAAGDVAAQIALQQTIKFNGGGHINHSLFWKNLAPPGSKETRPEAAVGLVKAIEATWGSLEEFKRAFGASLLGIQGSGWGWLVKEGGNGGGLRIVTTKDQDPVVGGDVPVFGVDMWEHAYYLQYLNGKAAYVENIWKVINWATAGERFGGVVEEKNEL